MTKKKFFKIVLLVVVLVLVFDIGFGWCMRWYMTHNDIPGDYRKIEYIKIGSKVLFSENYLKEFIKSNTNIVLD